MTAASFPRELIDRLDGWVNALAAPILPPVVTPVGGDAVRLEFRQHLPHTVMIGKLVRAVSGLRAALVLAPPTTLCVWQVPVRWAQFVIVPPFAPPS